MPDTNRVRALESLYGADPVRRRRSRRGWAGAAAALVLASSLAACGSSDGGTPVLTWYINPDSGGQDEIASRCTEQAGGAYRIETSQLPRESNAQREQLVRRLAANDSSIDLMSLDPPFIPEFAEAGFLAEVPGDVAERVTADAVESSIAGSTWNDQLVAVPFWANTQLLWYRKSVAEAAGLDMEQPVTWDQLVDAAESQDKRLGAQGIRAEALTVWLNALVESAGGSIIEEITEDPGDYQLGLESDAGNRAAEVMARVANSPSVGAAFDTANEDAAANGFESEDGGFMVNWPYVWPRANTAVEGGTLDASVPEDYGWTVYPRVDADKESAPPYGGINLGIGAFAEDTGLAFEAAECIVSVENQAYYFTTNGNPASSKAVYDDPEVLEVFPMAPAIRESLDQAAPRPLTPYYSEVSVSLQRTYHPTGSVEPGVTGSEATELILAVLRKEKLL